MEIIAFFAIVGSLFLWGIFLLVECGAAMFAPWAEALGIADLIPSLRWEAANIFLIFSLAGLVIFFPGALPMWFGPLTIPLVIFLGAMVLRVCGMALMRRDRRGRSCSAWIAMVGGFLSPAIFAGSIFSYFFLGPVAFTTAGFSLDLAFAVTSAAAALLIASSYFYFVRRRATGHHDLLASCVQLTFAVFVVVAVFPEYLGSTLLYRVPLIGPWYVLIFTISLLAVAGAVLLMKRERSHPGLVGLLAVMMLGVLALGACLAQVPYLIYSSTTVYDVFIVSSIAGALLGFFILGLVVAVAIFTFLSCRSVLRKPAAL